MIIQQFHVLKTACHFNLTFLGEYQSDNKLVHSLLTFLFLNGAFNLTCENFCLRLEIKELQILLQLLIMVNYCTSSLES